MNDLLNAEPVELTSDALSDTSFSGMSDEPAVEPLYDLVLITDNDGTGTTSKVRVYSIDVGSPAENGLMFAASATLSLARVPARIAEALMVGNYNQLQLRLKRISIAVTSGYINRVSWTEEDENTCSLILDVKSPHISFLQPSQ